MAKALKVVAIVAGAVAVVATAGAALGLGAAIASVGIGSAAAIASVASVISAVASLGAQALTKPPPARGSVAQVMRDPNAPSIYPMGEGYVGGAVRHDTAYGPTLNKVPNPYRFIVIAYGVAGPVESISPRVDFQPVGSWYNTYLYTDTQLGASPEGDALSPQWAGAPGWNAASRMSGVPAIGWSFKFDKDGKRFASGLPLLGAYGRWVRVYDPRKDSQQPGGNGTHRLGIESTYQWSQCPALHAGMYAYGRYQNGNGPLLDGTPATGKRVMGVGFPVDGIDWQVVAAWANICDDNEWSIFGIVYEGGANESERRWNNLKDICYAGGGEPVLTGKLSFKYHAPRVALDTITADDLTDDDQSVVGMQTYADRLNTIVPKYISANHNWEMVDAEAIVNANFLSDDGEEKREVWPFNLVKDKDQAAQLAAYRLFDTRELAGISLVCKPRLRAYRPGECLHLDLPELGLDTDAIILSRQIDPQTMKVSLELMGETPGKHDFCLGRTGTAPPTPALLQSPQQRDEIGSATGIGEDGVSPALVTLETDKPFAKYSGGGAYIGGAITFTGARQNIPADADWGWTFFRVSDGAVLIQEMTAAYLVETFPGQFISSAPWILTLPAASVSGILAEHGAFRVRVTAPGYGASASRTIDRVNDGAPGQRGQDGTSAFAVLSKNENHILPADADGNVLSYNGAVETLQVLYNGADVTSNFSLSVIDNPQSLIYTIDATTVTVSDGLDVSEPNAVLGLRLTGVNDFDGVNLERDFGLTKSRAGADGASPPLLHLEAVPNLARYDGNNAYNGGAIKLTTTRQNVAPEANWVYFFYRVSDGLLFGGDTAAELASTQPQYFASNGQNLTLFASVVELFVHQHGDFRVEARTDAAPGITDSVTIQKVREGSAGIPGFNTAAITIYRRAATVPALPTGTTEYNFATRTIIGLNNGWSTTIPFDDGTGNPVFASAAVASSREIADLIQPGEWAEAEAILASGGDGLNTAVITLFKRAPDGAPPAPPTTTTTVTFTTGAASGQNNGWAQAFPATNGQPAWAITAAASSAGATDTIAPGQWSEARKVVKDGDAGQDAVTVSPASYSTSVRANSAGVVNSDDLPISVQFTVRRGSTDISLLATTDYTVTIANGSGSMGGPNDRIANIATMAADKTEATVSIYDNGVLVAQPVVTVTKARAGAAATSNSTTLISAPTSSTYGPIHAGPLAITTGAGGRAYAYASLAFYNASSTSNIRAKVQYRTSPDGNVWSDWADMAPETSSDGPSSGETPGSLSLSTDIAHSGAGRFYQMRLLLRTTMIAAPENIQGTFMIEWKP